MVGSSNSEELIPRVGEVEEKAECRGRAGMAGDGRRGGGG